MELYVLHYFLTIHLGAAISALVLLFIHLLFHARRYIRGRKFFFTAGAGFG